MAVMVHLALALQWLVAIVFATAAASKLRRPAYQEFVNSTGRLLPARWKRARRLVAAVVLVAESLVTLLLLLPLNGVVPGLCMAVVLNTAFAVSTGAALRRGERTPCRCFGASSTPLGRTHVARNLILVACAALALAGRLLLQPLPLRPAGVLCAAAAAVLLAALLVRLDDLVALFGPTTADATIRS